MFSAKKSQGFSLNMIVIGAIALVILVILITILVSSMRTQEEQRKGVYDTVDLIEWCKCAKTVAPNNLNAKAMCEPVESLVGEFGDKPIQENEGELFPVDVASTTSAELDESCGELGG